MPVAVARGEGVAAVAVVSDCTSVLPSLCKLIKTLCFYKGLLQPSVVSALGVIQIMVGLFSIGLGPGHTLKNSEGFADLGAPYWLGIVYITSGIMSAFTGRSSSLCLMGVAVLVNIVGVIFAIVGIVLYATDLGSASVTWMCHSTYSDVDYNCIKLAYIAQRLLTAMDVTMIVLTVLQLCVGISFAVLGIKTLLRKEV